MKRKLLRIPVLPALSSLLLVTVLVLWGRSPRCADVFLYYTPAGQVTGIASDETGLLIAVTDVPIGNRFAVSADVLTGTREQFARGIHGPLFDGTYARWRLLGFRGATGTFGTMGWTFRVVIVPYWAPVIPLAILPLIAVRRVIVARRRPRAVDLPIPAPSPRLVWARVASWSFLSLVIATMSVMIVRGRRAARTEVPEPRTVLDRRITEVALENVSLEAAVDRLGKLSGTRIETSDSVTRTAADYRVPLILPMHLRLRSVSVATVLELVSNAASARNLDLTFLPRPDGTIFLQERSAAPLTVRVYELRNAPTAPDVGRLARLCMPRGRQADATAFGRAGAPEFFQIGSRLAVVANWRDQARVATALEVFRGDGAETLAKAAILAAADREVGPIEVHDMPLAEAIDQLGEQAGVSLAFDWSSLAPRPHRAYPGTPIMIHLARQAIRAALVNLFWASGDRVQLSYSAEDNVLVASDVQHVGKLPG